MPRSTLTDFLDALSARSGEATALHYGNAVVSYADLAGRSRRVAQGLADLGVGAGDRVALWLPNAPAWLELFFACARLKAIVVAVNTRFRAHEVGDIVGRSGAKVLVIWPGFKGIDFPAILSQIDVVALSSLRMVVVYSEDGEGHGEQVAGLSALAYGALEGAEPFAGDASAPDAGCIVYTTSGTTSRPKFVLHPQRSHVDHARAVVAALAMDAGDAASLLSLPLAGTYGMASAMAALASGRPAALMPTFEADAAARLVRTHAITHMNGSDEMYLRMLDAVPEERPFPSLRCCGFAAFGGDPGEIVKHCDSHGLRLIGLYGMSEVQALFALRDLAAPAAERMHGGGNLASPEAAVRVRDPESGALLGPGEQGELEIKGPSMMLEYLGNAQATADTLTADGYIRTGDLGFLDGAQAFTYLARMGDAIRLGGYLVAPEEISNFLESHPSVAGAQVVGVDGAALGAARGVRAVAFVIPARDTAFSEEDLRGHCEAGLAKFKVPARIFSVEAFPVTESANGVKVQRGKLRDLAISMIGGD